MQINYIIAISALLVGISIGTVFGGGSEAKAINNKIKSDLEIQDRMDEIFNCIDKAKPYVSTQ